jgi:TonB family protein
MRLNSAVPDERSLAAAFGISLVAHVVFLVFGPDLRVPPPPPEKAVQVRLIEPKREPPPEPKPAPKPEPKPEEQRKSRVRPKAETPPKAKGRAEARTAAPRGDRSTPLRRPAQAVAARPAPPIPNAALPLPPIAPPPVIAPAAPGAQPQPAPRPPPQLRADTAPAAPRPMADVSAPLDVPALPAQPRTQASGPAAPLPRPGTAPRAELTVGMPRAEPSAQLHDTDTPAAPAVRGEARPVPPLPRAPGEVRPPGRLALSADTPAVTATASLPEVSPAPVRPRDAGVVRSPQPAAGAPPARPEMRRPSASASLPASASASALAMTETDGPAQPVAQTSSRPTRVPPPPAELRAPARPLASATMPASVRTEVASADVPAVASPAPRRDSPRVGPPAGPVAEARPQAALSPVGPPAAAPSATVAVSPANLPPSTQAAAVPPRPVARGVPAPPSRPTLSAGVPDALSSAEVVPDEGAGPRVATAPRAESAVRRDLPAPAASRPAAPAVTVVAAPSVAAQVAAPTAAPTLPRSDAGRPRPAAPGTGGARAPRISFPGLPSGAGIDQAALDAFGLGVARHIGESRRDYPLRARRLRQEGTAEVVVKVGADGKVKDITVTRSSGHRLLDEEAVERVRSVLPLPKAPPDLRGREFSIQVPISFKLVEP